MLKDVFATLVGLIAIVQFLIKTETWSPPKRITTLIVLGAISVLIFSFKDSVALMGSAAPNNNVAAITNTTTNESYYNSSQNLEPAVITNAPVSPTQTPQEQTVSTGSSSTPYNIYRSSKVLELKRGKHYPYICDPEIKNCLGFTMKFSYQLPEGNYVKNVWLVCVRENGDGWVQVGEITINEGEEKEFKIRFDRAISFSEIVIQRPIDYNDYMHTDSLSIYDIIYS